MIAWIRALAFSMGMIVSIVLVAPIFFTIGLLSYNLRIQIAKVWCRFILHWLKYCCHIYYQVEGLDNIPNTPCIFVSNHQSTFETLLLFTLLPSHTTILKRELLWIPFFGWALALTHPIAINRQSGRKAFMSMLQQAKQVTQQQKRSILIFPEGTRVRPHEDKPYKKGAFLLAEQLHLPLVPISHNAGLAWRKKQFIKQAGTIHMVIGQPIQSNHKSADELLTLSKQWIETNSATKLAPPLSS